MKGAFIWQLMVLSLLSGCATYHQRSTMLKPQSSIVVGSTTKNEILKLLGKPSEQHIDQGQSIWVYSDTLDVPFAVGFIPIIGDIVDATEMAHTNKELIIQFDQREVVKKYKLRTLE